MICLNYLLYLHIHMVQTNSNILLKMQLFLNDMFTGHFPIYLGIIYAEWFTEVFLFMKSHSFWCFSTLAIVTAKCCTSTQLLDESKCLGQKCVVLYFIAYTNNHPQTLTSQSWNWCQHYINRAHCGISLTSICLYAHKRKFVFNID